MINVTRRAFLHTLTAATVGAVATFDPLRKLWIPGSAPGAIVAAAPMEPDVVVAPASVNLDEFAELQDIALRFAQQMANRLERWRGHVLEQVLCRQMDGVRVRSADSLLEIGGLGRGAFVPANRRVVKTGNARAWGNSSTYLDYMAAEMMSDIRKMRVDMFAPVGIELRPGVAFTEAMVATATDPQSGLSARAIRYNNFDGIRMERLTGVEMAVGVWEEIDTSAARMRRIAEQEERWIAENERALIIESAEEADGTVTAGRWPLDRGE